MSTTKHTAEPWHVAAPGPDGCPIIGRGGVMIAKLAHSMNHNEQSVEAKANASRIIACVNALAGVDDPEVVKRVKAALSNLEMAHSVVVAGAMQADEDDSCDRSHEACYLSGQAEALRQAIALIRLECASILEDKP